jgi:hypothetical protein
VGDLGVGKRIILVRIFSKQGMDWIQSGSGQGTVADSSVHSHVIFCAWLASTKNSIYCILFRLLLNISFFHSSRNLTSNFKMQVQSSPLCICPLISKHYTTILRALKMLQFGVRTVSKCALFDFPCLIGHTVRVLKIKTPCCKTN